MKCFVRETESDRVFRPDPLANVDVLSSVIISFAFLLFLQLLLEVVKQGDLFFQLIGVVKKRIFCLDVLFALLVSVVSKFNATLY
jgi:hypothetical protein